MAFMTKSSHRPLKGRGALNNPDNRFHAHKYERVDDGWGNLNDLTNPLTELIRDTSRTIIARNQSPDVPFDQSINPYRGCEHGCVYCFARPTHAYLGYSPGLDFETKLHYKPDAEQLLRNELNKKNYRCKPIALGVNTDAYQPIERKLKITRSLLEVLSEYQHPVSIITKSALIERDIDILEKMASKQLAQVVVSITTLDVSLARLMEPRTASPTRRLALIENLTQAGVPTAVLVAPVIPFLNDQEISEILSQVHKAGALNALYVLLRLPLEVEELFTDWLHTHFPDKADRIMNRLRDCRGGKSYDSRFGVRMRGEGIFADLISKRFHQRISKLNFPGMPDLRCDLFQPSPANSDQLDLFS